MYSKTKQLFILILLPFLLGSSHLELTEEDLQNNRDYYEVINATTGEKIERTLYAPERVIKTHIKSVSAIKKALANEGIDPQQVRVLLYYDGLTIADSSPPRMWQSKPHRNTISSPWLDLTRTVATDGKTKVTVRIDATAARLLSDLYSKPESEYGTDRLLAIPSIRQSCYSKMFFKYETFDFLIFKAIDKT